MAAQRMSEFIAVKLHICGLQDIRGFGKCQIVTCVGLNHMCWLESDPTQIPRFELRMAIPLNKALALTSVNSQFASQESHKI